ncbi:MULTISPECIES: hypothetical protein [Microvirga]|uniref:Peptidase M41 domain-containing protein n=2 Tax=Microvirga TaxID=186650 RepID=A0ABW9Z843_9HYPH|nr:hypothetical protein [Microvirga arsenatis]NBJ13072.1 hypothetical protein [Microvirga arsenatis]NBJ26809.1 hypothetical protein [Microvirga arsenatis]
MSGSTESPYPDKLRVAIHEVGHIAVGFYGLGLTVTAGIYELEPGKGDWRGNIPPGTALAGFHPTTADDWGQLVAFECGGWAAVHLATLRGDLPSAPHLGEQMPGDAGVLGPPPSDEANARKWCQMSGHADPVQLYNEARALAVDMVRSHYAQVMALARALHDREFVADDDVIDALS